MKTRKYEPNKEDEMVIKKGVQYAYHIEEFNEDLSKLKMVFLSYSQ
ncbi:MAG: hypothetical protein K0B02_03060 [DPANN group archaeon]|nr:hypothetical protein [DPANN group archaeon]